MQHKKDNNVDGDDKDGGVTKEQKEKTKMKED